MELWHSNDTTKDDVKDFKSFDGRLSLYAERYGGRGVGTNGGGVRCGLVNNVQVKGVGPNPLRGKDRDFFHSYGGASLNECMYEAIWSEIITTALPHGSVRSLAIANTGERVPLLAPKPKQEPTTPGAILFREPCLRPAHYMRAIDFDPIEDFSIYPSDVERTRAAIKSLPTTLSSLFYEAGQDKSHAPYDVYDLLTPIFTRAADQIAAARAKRIMHGSLIDSNFSIDGRWLDFSTTSSVPDFAPLLISPGAPDFLQEERLIYQTIGDLVVYLEKYGDIKRGLVREHTSTLCRAMNDRLNQKLPFEFSKLSGIPHTILTKLDPKLVETFYAAQRQVIATAHLELSTIVGLSDSAAIEYLNAMNQSSGTQLNDVMRLLAMACDEAHADSSLTSVVQDQQLRMALISAYFALRAASIASLENTVDTCKFSTRFFALNAVRVNASVAAFYRPVLYAEIEQTILAKANVAEYVNRKIADGRTLFGEPHGGTIELDGWLGRSTQLHLNGCIEIDGERTSSLDVLMNIADPDLQIQVHQCMN